MRLLISDLYIKCDDLIKDANILYKIAKNKGTLHKDDELYTNFLIKCKKTTNTYYHKHKASSISNNSISCC